MSTGVLGAVLCGGASSRMGSDKALVEVDGRAMAVRVAEALRAAGCNPVVAVGGDEPALAARGLHVVTDEFPGAGPLGAMVVALRHAAASGCDRVTVVACDLPWLSGLTLGRLVERSSHGDVDVVMATTSRVEPLCAVWRVDASRAVSAAFHAGRRAVLSAVDVLGVAFVPVDPAHLRNVNRPADLPAAR